MSSQIHVLAILVPAEGKADRLKELLKELALSVESHETNVTSYQVYEQTNGEGTNVIVLEESYKNKEAYEAHFVTPQFLKLGAAVQAEGLFAMPMNFMNISPFAGFLSR